MTDDSIFDLENDDLLDRFDQDPKGVLTQLADEIRSDLRDEIDREKAEADVARTYEQFQEKYPDFKTRLESGEIKDFIQKNPGHNAISAYYMLTKEQRINEGIADALKKRSPSGDAALKDSKKFGGHIGLMAKRLANRRAGGSGKDSSSAPSGGLIPTI